MKLRNILGLFFAFLLAVGILIPAVPVNAEKLTDKEENSDVSLNIRTVDETVAAGEKYYYEIDYGFSALEGTHENPIIKIELPEEIEFSQIGNLTDHIENYEYNEERHTLILEFKPNTKGGANGTVSFWAAFPNYVTPDGTEAEVNAKLINDDEVVQAADPVTTIATAEADWSVEKYNVTSIEPKPGEEVTYEIEFLNNLWREDSNVLMIDDVTIEDQLPEEAIFVSASDNGYYDEDTHTVIWNMEEISLKQQQSRDPLILEVTVTYPDELPYGTEVTNSVTADYSPLKESPEQTSDEITHGFDITTVANMDAIKWVKGDLDSNWSHEPTVGQTTKNGNLQYKIVLTNTGNTAMKNINIIDVLPHIDDTGVLSQNDRKSEWSPILIEPVNESDYYNVYYSTSDNVSMEEEGTENPENNWLTEPPTDLTTVTALKFVTADDFIINPGESIEIVWSMSAPEDTKVGTVAWNSFGHTEQMATGGDRWLSPVEPPKVGIEVKEDPNEDPEEPEDPNEDPEEPEDPNEDPEEPEDPEDPNEDPEEPGDPKSENVLPKTNTPFFTYLLLGGILLLLGLGLSVTFRKQSNE